MQFNFNWRCKWPPFGIPYIVNASIMKIYAKIYLLNGFSKTRMLISLPPFRTGHTDRNGQFTRLKVSRGLLYVKFNSKLYKIRLKSACPMELLGPDNWTKYEFSSYCIMTSLCIINLYMHAYDKIWIVIDNVSCWHVDQSSKHTFYLMVNSLLLISTSNQLKGVHLHFFMHQFEEKVSPRLREQLSMHRKLTWAAIKSIEPLGMCKFTNGNWCRRLNAKQSITCDYHYVISVHVVNAPRVSFNKKFIGIKLVLNGKHSLSFSRSLVLFFPRYTSNAYLISFVLGMYLNFMGFSFFAFDLRDTQHQSAYKSNWVSIFYICAIGYIF